MPAATVNGIDLHYEIAGEGPVVVWGHGLMGSIARQRQAGEGIDGLERHGFRLVSYDARGHGKSGFTDDEADYSWAAHAGDRVALMDHLGIDRAHVGGGSMGAGVSLTFALKYPERVEKLVLVAPPPMADTIEPAQQMFGAFATLIESTGIGQAVELAMQLPQFAELQETQPEEYEEMRRWLLSQRPKAVVPAIRGLLNGPMLEEERFRELARPALIVVHPDDEIHPVASGEKLHEAIKGSRLIVAPEQGYYQQHHNELLDTVATFLSGDDGATQAAQ